MSDSLQLHGLQHRRPPCSSPTPRVYPNSCPLSWWCHPTISSSVIPFSSDLQSFPTSGSFHESALHIRWPRYWSYNFSISPSNEYSDWFPLGYTRWISLQSKGLSRIFSNTTVQKHYLVLSFLYSPILTAIHTTGKTIALTRWTFVDKVMSLLFNMLSRLVITFLPRNKHLLISWLQSPSAVILEPPKIKSVTVSHSLPIYLPWSDGTGCHDLSFLNVEP